jgi:hypothetical protein
MSLSPSKASCKSNNTPTIFEPFHCDIIQWIHEHGDAISFDTPQQFLSFGFQSFFFFVKLGDFRIVLDCEKKIK